MAKRNPRLPVLKKRKSRRPMKFDEKKFLQMAKNHPVVAKAVRLADEDANGDGDDDQKSALLIAILMKYLGGPHPTHPDRITVTELIALLKFVLAIAEALPPETEIPVPHAPHAMIPDIDGDEAPVETEEPPPSA
jgi:hypothetical protein